MVLIREHLFLGPLRSLPLLAADLGDPLLHLALLPQDDPFDLIGKGPPGDKAVERLIALCLAFHLDPGGDVLEPDARRNLVDVLAAVAAGANERFFDVLFEDAEALHPEAQGLFLVRGHAGIRHSHAFSIKPIFMERPKIVNTPQNHRKNSFFSNDDIDFS